MVDPKDKDILLIEVHNHQGRECDLPAVPDAKEVLNTDRPFDRRKCHYDWQYTGHGICSCSMCHDPYGMKQARRKDRHEAKQELKKLPHAVTAYKEEE